MNAQQRRAQLRAKPVYDAPAEHEAEDEDTERPETHAYQINRWECPECGVVHEDDADFEPVEKCAGCGVEVTVTT